MNHLVVGSGFSALGTVLGLLSLRKKNIFVINANNKKINSSINVNKIKLISRNFQKYKKEINSSFKINRIISNYKSNFITYLGQGGLSTIWGKLLNTEIIENYKNINFVKKKLKLKKHELVYSNKNFLLFKNQEANLKPFKTLKNLERKKLIKIINTNYIEKIAYNKIEKKFEVFSYKKEKICTKKLYIASGFFSSIKFVKDLVGEKNFKQPIKMNHKDMLYGFFLNKKENFIRKKIDEFFFLDKKHKYISGKIINLNKYYIKKYSLNPIFYIFLIMLNFCGYNIFLFNFFYKKKNKTNIFLKNDNIIIESTKTYLNKNYLNIFKNKYNNYFHIKFIYAIKTYTGSDFHYTAELKKNINNVKKYPPFKNLYISAGSFVKKNYFFPTFYLILNSYYNVKKNINFYKF